MSKSKKPAFNNACLIDSEQFYAVASKSLWLYAPKHAERQGLPSPWLHQRLKFQATALCIFRPDESKPGHLCVASTEGDILLGTDQGTQREKIPDVWALCCIAQIGVHLYATGVNEGCARVWRRFGANDWRRIDNDQMRPESTAIWQDEDFQAYRKERGYTVPQEITEETRIYSIAGLHENALYAVGWGVVDFRKGFQKMHPIAFFYNGENWQEIPLPDDADRICDIYIESDERIWLCGWYGTLLLGNVRDGFYSLGQRVEESWHFFNLCRYHNQIVLAAGDGPWIYEPHAPECGIWKVQTDLTPEVQDSYQVFCRGENLWSIGSRDILRYDGYQWQRIERPDKALGGQSGKPLQQTIEPPIKAHYTPHAQETNEDEEEAVDKPFHFAHLVAQHKNTVILTAFASLTAPQTQIWEYCKTRPAPHWFDMDMLGKACAVTGFNLSYEPKDGEKQEIDDIVVLNEQGRALFLSPTHNPVKEDVLQSHWNAGSRNKVWLLGLKQVGTHLYACGSHGQLYRRSDKGIWCQDDVLLQAIDTPAEQRIDLAAINGMDEYALYVGGWQNAHQPRPKLFFSNGEHWQDIALPKNNGRITDMVIDSEQRVWLCGSEGLFMLGDARQGFINLLKESSSNLHFSSLRGFKDKLYLASNQGLFVFDANAPKRGLVLVNRDLTDSQRLDITPDGDCLWSMGRQAITRFDGETWQRIQFPYS